MEEIDPAHPAPVRGRSLATVSLACGLIGLPLATLFLFGIAAVITGFWARLQLPRVVEARLDRRIAAGGMALGAFSLAVCLFESPTANVDAARRTTSLATATALESAINSFHAEYGKMPGAPAVVRTNSKEGVELLNNLLGMNPGRNPENPRDIRFLSVRQGKNHRNGLMYEPDESSVIGLFDPWGNPYVVETDQDGTGRLRFSMGGKPVNLTDRHVAVFSPGADGKDGTQDDIKTW